jgi:hypothetical protein
VYRILTGLTLASALIAASFGVASAQMYSHRGTWGQALPSGTYQQSCRRARVNQGVLTATCSSDNGTWIRSSLLLSRCQPWSDVGNVNGRLRCVHNRR